MRFEVPQFIEVEDKIFGPFTWKQFIYIAGGAGALIVLYLSTPFWIFALIGIPIAAFSGFLAFHRINNRPFSLYLESAFRYFTNARLYLWKRQREQVIRGEATPVTPMPQETNPEGEVARRQRLNSLSRQLELDALKPPETDQYANQ